MTCPDILYKYTSAPTAKIILESERLRWSCPSLFNDLNEFQRMPVFYPSLEEDWVMYIQKMVEISYGNCSPSPKEFSPETLLLLALISCLKATAASKEELFNLVYLACPVNQSRMTEMLREFSQCLNNDSARVLCLADQFDNDVMWAHYADNHSGCVLGFKHLPERDTPFQEAKPIQYTCGPPVIGRALDYLLYGNTPELRRSTMNAILYSKALVSQR